MAGYTGFTVGLINNHYVYLPIHILTTQASMIDPSGTKDYINLLNVKVKHGGDSWSTLISLTLAIFQTFLLL